MRRSRVFLGCFLLAVVWSKPYCPEVACSEYLAEARWTGRVAIVVTGFIRTALENLPILQEIQRKNKPTIVELYYHVWYNASASCDVRALKILRKFASVSFEPTSCAWSWGNGGFPNHWHIVYNSFRALRIVHGLDPLENFGIVLSTGTDVRYRDDGVFFHNFSHLWERYASFEPHHNFAVLGYANGFDRHAFGTPALMRAYGLYGPDDGFGCDSKLDAFPFQRFKRYGVTQADWRCAPLFSKIGGVFNGALLRPSETIGCREHSSSRRRRRRRLLSDDDDYRRSLAIAPPKDFASANRSFCANHQFDTFLAEGTLLSRTHNHTANSSSLHHNRHHPIANAATHHHPLVSEEE